MTLDELYERVTEAILRAETLEDEGNSAEAQGAYLAVSLLEAQIAERLSAAGAEGAIARRGAVRAAQKAGERARADALAERYGVDLGSLGLAEKRVEPPPSNE